MPNPLIIRLKTICFLDYFKKTKLVKHVLKYLRKKAALPSVKNSTSSHPFPERTRSPRASAEAPGVVALWQRKGGSAKGLGERS